MSSMKQNNLEFTVSDMLGNMACACQDSSLIDEPVTSGAIIRSIYQWLDLNHYTIEDAKQELKFSQYWSY